MSQEDKIDREAKEATELPAVEKRLLLAVESAGKIFYGARAEDRNGNLTEVFSVEGADANVAKAMMARLIYDELKHAGENEDQKRP